MPPRRKILAFPSSAVTAIKMRADDYEDDDDEEEESHFLEEGTLISILDFSFLAKMAFS